MWAGVELDTEAGYFGIVALRGNTPPAAKRVGLVGVHADAFGLSTELEPGGAGSVVKHLDAAAGFGTGAIL